MVSAKDVEKARATHPDALFLVHPECRQEVVEQADYVAPPQESWNLQRNLNIKNLSSEQKTAL